MRDPRGMKRVENRFVQFEVVHFFEGVDSEGRRA